MILVFQFVDDVGCLGVGLIIEEGRGPLDGYQVPEEFGHLVFVGVEVEVGSGQVEVALDTNDLFRYCQPMATDHAESWSNQVEQASPETNDHGDLRIYDFSRLLRIHRCRRRRGIGG